MLRIGWNTFDEGVDGFVEWNSSWNAIVLEYKWNSIWNVIFTYLFHDLFKKL